MSKKPKRHFFPFWILLLGMAVSVLYLGGQLIYGEIQSRKVHQEIVELGELSYDEAFLDEISKAEGFLSVSPVYEIPVKLRWEAYTMDAIFTAVDMKEFQMTGNAPEEISLGNTPVLFIGKDALNGLTDSYGHTISQNGLKKLKASSEELEYCLQEESAAGVGGGAQASTAQGSRGNDSEIWLWRPCIAVGDLISPSDGIYIPITQTPALTEGLPPVKKVLLTTQGTKPEIL